MNKELTILIIDPGDPDVGFFSRSWEITGGIIPQDQEHREEIRKAITEAFKTITSGHYVIFSDEIPEEYPKPVIDMVELTKAIAKIENQND